MRGDLFDEVSELLNFFSGDTVDVSDISAPQKRDLGISRLSEEVDKNLIESPAIALYAHNSESQMKDAVGISRTEILEAYRVARGRFSANSSHTYRDGKSAVTQEHFEMKFRDGESASIVFSKSGFWGSDYHSVLIVASSKEFLDEVRDVLKFSRDKDYSLAA